MSDILNLLLNNTDHTSETSTIADDTMPVITSTNDLLKFEDINIISDYNSANLGSDINSRFADIDSNFKRIIQSDYLQGKPGSNYVTKHIYFAKKDPNRVDNQNTNYKNPILYNPVIKNGSSDPVIMNNDYIIKNIQRAILTGHGITNSSKLWDTSLPELKSITTPNGGRVNWHDNIASGSGTDYNTFTFITEDNNGSLYAYSSLVYIFIDKRFEYITDSNKEQYNGLTDLSCAIYFTYKNTDSDSYGGDFVSINSFPTLSYNSNDGNFYWKIYGSESGLLAQGPKGDTTSNALIYCTYINPTINEGEIRDYVIIKDVLVTYIDKDTSKEITAFVDIDEAIKNNYINLEIVKNRLNHIKICAFCVPHAINNATRNEETGEDIVATDQQIIAGTICYSNSISKSTDSKYIVRFNENLSFNHLFNQHNFFNTMLRNCHNGELNNLKNGYGLMFIPMNACGNLADQDTSAHTIIPGYSVDTDDKANILNILPIKNINNDDIRSKLADKTNLNAFIDNIDDILMSDCPMDIYYKVRMINQPLVFKTPKVNISDTSTETEESYKVDYNSLNHRAAQFDITYKPEGEKNTHFSGTKYNINPTLDIEYTWDNDESIINKDNISKDQINVRPKLGLNGIALYLKHKDSLNQSVLDFIKDGVNDISDNRGDSQYNHNLKYINTDNDESHKKEFYLNLIAGTISQSGSSNIPEPYTNYISNKSIYFPTEENTSAALYKTYKNNIYPYGAVYPRRKKTNWSNNTEYRSYDSISLYAVENDNKVEKSDFASLSININNPNATKSGEFVCPVFSIYRDYRTGYKLETAQKTQTNNNVKIHEYNKSPINAIQSHPLDYINNDNIGNQDNIRSHEGVVYPHKILLTNSANQNDKPSSSNKWQGHTIDSEQTSSIHNFENYGTIIAYIAAPKPDDSDGIILNEEYLDKNEWDFKIKFNNDKLIAPIINIRSNAIASPGTDFMRLRSWSNGGSWHAAYNLINTCLSINHVSHSLMYRYVYQYIKDGYIYRGTTNNQRLTPKITQDIQTGICGNINSNFVDKDKSIKSNTPMVGHLCNPNLMSRAGYPITTADPINIAEIKEYKGLGGYLNGGNGYNAADGDHLPWSTTSLINQFSNRVNPHNFCKYYSHNSMCTPIDTMYNIGEYNINRNGISYRGNDGYRTITLPYYPGDNNYLIRLNKSVITDIRKSIENGKSNAAQVAPVTENINSRIVSGPVTPKISPEIVGVQIIYNCEVLFDTLLDVISGMALRCDDKNAGVNNAWRHSDGINLRICDAIPHSKFIKHDISTQIGNTYASSGDIDGCNLSNFKLGAGVNENYSGYRGQIDWISKSDNSWKVIGSGYYYATMYDLDSYYNRLFMNPYYIYERDGKSKYNFSSILDKDSYIKNGQYIYPKGSKRHLDNNALVDEITTNHPPYFMGVGLIDCKDNEEFLSIYKNYKNKGIIYLCHKDDKAYEDVYVTGEFHHSDTSNGIYLRNDVINKNICSPFVKTYIKKAGDIIGFKTNDQDSSNNDSVNKDEIRLWYPMSTDIFNNPYMFNESEEVNISESSESYIAKHNYKPTRNNDPLSNGFDLDKIKLAFRKCNIKTTSTGYYNGHDIEYGELDNCNISILNGSQDSDIVTVAKFINEDQSQALSYSSSETNDNNFTQNNTVSANICNDGIVWKDDSSNYVAIHMTGNVDDYQNIRINKEIVKSDDTSPEQVNLAGSNGLPQTHMYISKNGSKSMYKVDFTKLLFAAGRLCEAMGITDGSNNKIDLITDGDLDELIEQSKQNNT